MIKVLIADHAGHVISDRYRAELEADADKWIAEAKERMVFGSDAVFSKVDISAEVQAAQASKVEKDQAAAVIQKIKASDLDDPKTLAKAVLAIIKHLGLQ